MVDSLLYKFYYPGSKIPIDQVDINLNVNRGAITNPLIPIDAIIARPHTPILGYTASSRFCVDCTLRGTNKKPDFWK